MGPEDFQRFEESDLTTLVGVIPVARKISTDLAEIAVEAITVNSDRMAVRFTLRLRDGHPELAWRERGRPGHPYTAIGLTDDVGTDYFVMPGSGGGGMKEWTHELRIVPAFPQEATTLTLSVAETEWEGHMGFLPDGSRAQPNYRWSVSVQTLNMLEARPIDNDNAQ